VVAASEMLHLMASLMMIAIAPTQMSLLLVLQGIMILALAWPPKCRRPQQ